MCHCKRDWVAKKPHHQTNKHHRHLKQLKQDMDFSQRYEENSSDVHILTIPTTAVS